LGRHAAVHTATADEPLADALERTHADPRPIAVMQDGRLVGVVEPDDIRTALREAHPAAVPALAGAGDQWPGRRR
jgi:Mg/Co/Ni transporter MgtE